MSYYIYKISGAEMVYYGSSMQDLCERKSSHKTQHTYYKKNGNGNKCSSYKILEATDDWVIEIIEPNIETHQEVLERENWYINNTECVNIKNAIGLTIDETRKYKADWKRWNALKTGKTPLIITMLSDDEKKTNRQKNWQTYYEANKESLLQKQKDAYAKKEFTEEDRQKERDRVKEYCELNKEKVKEAKMEYYEANKDELKEKMKASYEINKEERLKKQKAYYEANKEKINEKRRKKT